MGRPVYVVQSATLFIFKTLNRGADECIPVGKHAQECGMLVITEISNKLQVMDSGKLEGFLQSCEVRTLTQRGIARKAFA